MAIDTSELLDRLSLATSIQEFITENQNEFMPISCFEYLNELLGKKDVCVADVARKSGQGEYVYKVFQGKRKPSRDILICIAIGMGLSIDETQLLLRISQQARLDPRNRRDSIFLYSIKEKYSFEKLNELLYELNEQTI